MGNAQKTQKDQKQTASQRLDGLEQAMGNIYQTADTMAKDLMTIKEAIKLLGNKLDAVVKVSASGETLNDDLISKAMVQNNVSELAEKVTNLVSQGILVASEEVNTNSFVVGRELSEDGTIQNPRMQFVVSALNEDVKSKFPGNKVGTILALQEGKWSFEILEIYDIQTPTQPEATAEAAL